MFSDVVLDLSSLASPIRMDVLPVRAAVVLFPVVVLWISLLVMIYADRCKRRKNEGEWK